MRKLTFVLGALSLGLCAAGCGKGEASVALIFPNEAAMNAVRRIQVQVFPPSTGGSASSDRDCRDFEDLAREGKDALGTPTRGDFPCPETEDGCPEGWFDGLELQSIEAGRQIVYVLAYASTDVEATPILDGCTDRFDGTGGKDESNEVPIELSLVIPGNARLVKTAGDRQVGRPGEVTAVPLEVEVEAVSPAGGGVAYVIPGVPVQFEVQTPGFEIVDGASQDRGDTFSDEEGRARMQVRMPDSPAPGRVLARAPVLAEVVDAAAAQVEFSLSVTEPVRFSTGQVLQPGSGARPVDVALGRLDADADLDLVVLGCRGAPEGCVPGVEATAPFGSTELTVVQNLGREATVLPVAAEQGVLPAAVVVTDLEPPVGVEEIAVINSRRGDCQGRVCPAQGRCPCYGRAPGEPCPCEGSEVRVFGIDGAQVSLRSRQTMTASNAVDAAAYKSGDTEPYLGLAIASQGRSRNEQPCSPASPCLPHDPVTTPLCATEPESCGCPPGEACEPCQNCGANDPGVCVAQDKMVDLLEIDDSPQPRLYNRLGCQAYELTCDIANPQQSQCTCLDSEITGNACTGTDVCNCKVPERVYIGSSNSAVRPFAVAAGPLTSERDWDLVSPSIGGLELIENKTGGETFEWQWKPIINVPIHEAVVLHLDSQSEQDLGATRAADVVWYAREACSEGSNFQERCPLWREAAEGETPGGCLGVYFTAGEDSIFSITPPSSGGCRRHLLEHAPDGLCVGRINDDEYLDVVVASREASDLLVFTGDGRGGLLDPPEVVPLPAGGVGGPVDCGDLDEDGRDDVVVADAQTGAIYVLGTAP